MYVSALFVRTIVLVLSATVLVLVLEKSVTSEPSFDHERLDVYRLSDAIDEEPNRRGKSDLKRIVSMLTRLIQRKQTKTMAEEEIEYEYEYRDAEYEYEANPEA